MGPSDKAMITAAVLRGLDTPNLPFDWGIVAEPVIGFSQSDIFAFRPLTALAQQRGSMRLLAFIGRGDDRSIFLRFVYDCLLIFYDSFIDRLANDYLL